MSKTTTNYGLIKPELTDVADITEMNQNWDKIDELLGRKTVTAAMLASGWSGNTYSFESTYPKASNDISIEVAPTATAEQFEAFGGAMICGSADSNVATAVGDVPTIDIPIIIKVVKK